MVNHALLGRREFLKVGLGAAAAATLARALPLGAAQGRTEGARPPNIVFILADDIGWDGFSCYGSDAFKTPAIDALAADGLRFVNSYCTPLCGPTRCLFLTGRYGFRTGGLTNQTAGKPSPRDEIGVAKVLRDAGYATAHAGKWRQVGGTPDAWGFDEYITDPTASGYYWTKTYTKNGKTVQKDKEVYYHDELFDFAADFMARNKDKPFFLYFAMHLVHAPILRTPDSNGGGFYADNIAYMDKLVGKLMAELDKLKLRENTVVVFSADNGTAVRGATIGGKSIHGGKGTMMDGGSHVPLVASWKGTGPSGKVTKELMDFSDLLPTFAELAGAKVPADRTIDGRSFAPLLKGQPHKGREWIYVQLGRNWFVRDAGWKLDNQGDLFDMSGAPFEEKPVAADKDAAGADAARKKLQAVLDELKPGSGKTASQPARRPGGGGGRGARRRQGAAATQ